MSKHTSRLQNFNPMLTSRGIVMYQETLIKHPEFRSKVERLEISTVLPKTRMNLLYDKNYTKAFFDNGLMYIYVNMDEMDELEAGQVGPMNEVIKL